MFFITSMEVLCKIFSSEIFQNEHSLVRDMHGKGSLLVFMLIYCETLCVVVGCSNSYIAYSLTHSMVQNII